MQTREHPPAEAHGEIEELFPDVFFVTGGVTMNGPMTMRFSRNMTIVRQDGALTLINSVRLNDEGLAALDALGKVEHVIRLAGFHGMDDPFYKERYGAKVWNVAGQVYASEFDNAKNAEATTYFVADEGMEPDTQLPLSDARLIAIRAKVPEALLFLERDGGILVAGDCLQNWAKPDSYFNLPGKLMMRLMGFIKPHNVGPAWAKMTKPNGEDMAGLIELGFENLLPVHGAPVIGGAAAAFTPAIQRQVEKPR